MIPLPIASIHQTYWILRFEVFRCLDALNPGVGLLRGAQPWPVDRAAIVTEIEQSGFDASRTKSIIDAASAWSSRLRSEAEATEALGLLVDRVELRQDGIRLSIKLPIGSAEKLAGPGPTHLTLTRLIPMQMRRRGIAAERFRNPESRPQRLPVPAGVSLAAHPLD